MLGYLLIHSDHSGYLLFSEKKDLKHEMISFVSALGQPRLAHQDETRQKNCFESHVRAE